MEIDRQKYLQIFNSQGVNAALTQLHLDVRDWEYEAFEGEKGWQPALWSELEKVRNFSRELWEMALETPSPTRSKN
jgi:hypothetical protein